MIKRIVHLPAQLQVALLALKRDVLEERDVPVIRARQPDDVFWRVTEISPGRFCEDRGVEPSVETAVAARQDRIALDYEARAVAAARDVFSASQSVNACYCECLLL